MTLTKRGRIVVRVTIGLVLLTGFLLGMWFPWDSMPWADTVIYIEE